MFQRKKRNITVQITKPEQGGEGRGEKWTYKMHPTSAKSYADFISKDLNTL